MYMYRQLILIMAFFGLAAGCASGPVERGHLGYVDGRRVVIVGEKVDPGIAEYYQRAYDAMVWFTPSGGKIADSANRLVEGVGASRGMRMLMAELISINYTIGRWEIIIPKIAEKYFLATLSHMKTGALAKARGMIVLIDSTGNKEMEVQVKRVTGDNFFVTYELQKDLPK